MYIYIYTITPLSASVRCRCPESGVCLCAVGRQRRGTRATARGHTTHHTHRAATLVTGVLETQDSTSRLHRCRAGLRAIFSPCWYSTAKKHAPSPVAPRTLVRIRSHVTRVSQDRVPLDLGWRQVSRSRALMHNLSCLALRLRPRTWVAHAGRRDVGVRRGEHRAAPLS
jgi:hypothetical protein